MKAPRVGRPSLRCQVLKRLGSCSIPQLRWLSVRGCAFVLETCLSSQDIHYAAYGCESKRNGSEPGLFGGTSSLITHVRRSLRVLRSLSKSVRGTQLSGILWRPTIRTPSRARRLWVNNDHALPSDRDGTTLSEESLPGLALKRGCSCFPQEHFIRAFLWPRELPQKSLKQS